MLGGDKVTGARIGDRVLVLVTGLEILGVPTSDRVAASGTVIDMRAAPCSVTVHLDIGFNGFNIVNVPSERVAALAGYVGNP